MRHRADALLAEGEHPDALLAELLTKLGRRAEARFDLEDHDVRLDLLGTSFSASDWRIASARIWALA